MKLGHNWIAFVAGPPGNIEARERLRGYCAAIATAGASEWLVKGDFSEQSGRNAAGAFISDDRPDAVFCANDMMAIGCLEALRRTHQEEQTA